jgi:DNA-binding HxlR family transcriptional regulator
MNRSRLIAVLKKVFLSHKNRVYSVKQLSKKFDCSKQVLVSVLHELVEDNFLLRFEYGQRSVYALNPVVKYVRS